MSMSSRFIETAWELAASRFDGVPKAEQLEALELLAEHRRILLVQPTGWGKSFVFDVAARAVASTRRPLTVIVSPLKSLSTTLAAAQHRSDLSVVKWDSDSGNAAWNYPALIKAGGCTSLVLTPERFFEASFKGVWRAVKDKVGLLVLDEAHLVAIWGGNFRPEFVKLREVIKELPEALFIAASATVDEATARSLRQVTGRWHVVRGDLARPHVRMEREPVRPFDGHVQRLPGLLREHASPALVYATTRSEVESISRHLRGCGFDAQFHHADADKDHRQWVEKRLRSGDIEVVVATSSLGMGVDYPRLCTVVQLGLAPNIIEVMQRSGRAGRQGRPGTCVLMPLADPDADWRRLRVYLHEPDLESWVLQRIMQDLSKTGVAKLEFVNPSQSSHIESVLRRADSLGLIHLMARTVKLISADWSALTAMGVEEVSRSAEGKKAVKELSVTSACLEQFMLERLGQAETSPCGQCTTCRGRG